jgi:hypothetical protein
MAESRRRANLLSRLFSVPAANNVVHELDETLEEAQAFLRSSNASTPRTDLGLRRANVDGNTDETDEPEPQEISFDLDFESLSQLPWARAASVVGPFLVLVLLKLFYEAIPIVLTLVVLYAAHEWLYTTFHTEVELMKSMRPNRRWLCTLLNMALLVILVAYIFVDSATGLDGLGDALRFSDSGGFQLTTSVSVVTLLLALFLVNAIASMYVLVMKMFVCFSVVVADRLCVGSWEEEVSSHRDDDSESGFQKRYEKITTAIKVVGYMGLLYRTLLPIPFWSTFYGNARFAAGTLQGLYLLSKTIEVGVKLFAVGTVLKRLLKEGGDHGMFGVPLTTAEIVERGDADRHCPICFETLDAGRTPVRLECGHVYCQRCIGMWASEKQNASCAVCRAPIRVGEEDRKIDQYSADLAFHCNRWMPVIW